MKPEDQKRLTRERELWLATKGPDYSAAERDVALAKAEAAKGVEARREFIRRWEAGKARAPEQDDHYFSHGE